MTLWHGTGCLECAEEDPGESDPRRSYALEWKLVSQFAARDQAVSETRAWRYRRRLDVTRYVIGAQLAERFGADLSLTASAQLNTAVVAPTEPWLSFALDPKLEVDSARWGSGEPARMARKTMPSGTISSCGMFQFG